MSKLPDQLPTGLVREEPRFVPRLVMTEELQTVMSEVIHQWRKRAKFADLLKYGIRPLDRMLFFGPPGNGKTMACYWMARELKIPMYRVLCNNLHGSCMGETTKAISEVMEFLNRLNQPALCLWDEVEAIFIDRTVSSGQCDRELQAALTVFLQCLDRWSSQTLIVMATNLVEQLDAALLSRVELRLEFGGPSKDQCVQLIEYWSELLHANGGGEWGPRLMERMQERVPVSFRAMQQMIGCAARDWTARNK